MASGYEVTIKIYQHHMIERVTMRWMLLMYSIYFVAVTLLFPLLAKHNSAASDLLTSLSIEQQKHFIIAKAFYNCKANDLGVVWCGVAIVNRQNVFTRAKMNHIDSTRPAPLSMNELTTENWNFYAIWNSLKIFCNSKYQNPWDKLKLYFC